MRCPTCGALNGKHLEHCADGENLPVVKEPSLETKPTRSRKPRAPGEASRRPRKSAPKAVKQESRLINFPGTPRPPIPLWRKELSERVREIRDRRAREAADEAEKAEVNKDNETCVPQLELLPRPASVSTNPLVEAALRRIDRANHPPQTNLPPPMARAAVASAIPRTQDNGRMAKASEAPSVSRVAKAPLLTSNLETKAIAEITGNPSPTPPEACAQTTEAPTQSVESTPSLVAVQPANGSNASAKPRRLIGDDHDPALNYLDSIPTAASVEVRKPTQAPVATRLLAAILDLLFVIFLASPLAAALELVHGSWEDPFVIAVAVAGFLGMMFIYGTVSTALTGKTLGMKLLALQVIDAPTGLIPTGSQSASRALIYVASFLTFGSGILYAIIDRDKRPAHDRLTGTVVVRS